MKSFLLFNSTKLSSSIVTNFESNYARNQKFVDPNMQQYAGETG